MNRYFFGAAIRYKPAKAIGADGDGLDFAPPNLHFGFLLPDVDAMRSDGIGQLHVRTEVS